MAQRTVDNSLFGSNIIDWLSFSHGDDVDITVTRKHQHRGTPKNRHNCAVVQAILDSNPDVYDAIVQEGDVYIFIKEPSTGKYWKLRCLMDAVLRELAKQRYDIDYNRNGIFAEDTVITLRIDKLREILGPKPEAEATPTDPTTTKKTGTTLKSQILKDRRVPNNPLRAAKPRQPKRSRWDVTYFKIEKKA
jgi:hypothetical protein